MYGPSEFWAIQVQNSGRVRPADLRPLLGFRDDYPESACLLLHRGPDRRRIDEVWCLPVEEFLKALHPARTLAAAVEPRP